ncbi:AbrB/MazE/SpoVT family DNA-binding domain-containing protein [Methanonatronarchaeum sp. AMET-Sl]|uniref:AbrB/MazE/SpoVT family DNA-binding domain-containing protein n=1 Tax=Methanonatronarchaeum sp. AMET-Sl TaxID=3037654 RepID=UPI00244DA1DB|nr:AbrB/MazE/SpoVT family DNA-binding domain-containing protein [Methanonatronarchaeum sp. AMET-Sl]WGI16859.1 AbrB/MazE/SpoVT family DNA-binding domain-containing protein [Methanonatronarchaeum sp. AMET-Sl]
MSEIDMITVTSKGQISIPSKIRKKYEIEKGDKLFLATKDDTLILKKIDKEVLEKSIDEILKLIQEKSKKEGLKEEDACKIVKGHRKEKKQKNNDRGLTL